MSALSHRQRKFPRRRSRRSKKNGKPSRSWKRGRKLERRKRMGARTRKTKRRRRRIKIPRNQHLHLLPLRLPTSRLIRALHSIDRYSQCAWQITRSVDRCKSRRLWLPSYLVSQWPRVWIISRFHLLCHDGLLHLITYACLIEFCS